MNPAVISGSGKKTGFTVSLGLHVLLFLTGSFIFSKPAEYAVVQGSGGIEVYLTAAPAEAVAVETSAEEKKAEPVTLKEELKDTEDISAFEEKIEKKLPVETKPVEAPKNRVAAAMNTPFKGDGSSVIPGKDATTLYSGGGALTEAKPNYLRNPAPHYPLEARQKGWEGVVFLKVFVDKLGYPKNIEKEKSSGFDILDNSALKAVRSWKFRPAQLGNLPVDSVVMIPVRFSLENHKK